MNQWIPLSEKGRLTATREAFNKLVENEVKQASLNLFSDCLHGFANPVWKDSTKGFPAFQRETGILLDGAWQILRKRNPRLKLSNDNCDVYISPSYCKLVYADVREALEKNATPKDVCSYLNSNNVPGIGCKVWTEDTVKEYVKVNNLSNLTRKVVATW